jgi:hypothetical protein
MSGESLLLSKNHPLNMFHIEVQDELSRNGVSLALMDKHSIAIDINNHASPCAKFTLDDEVDRPMACRLWLSNEGGDNPMRVSGIDIPQYSEKSQRGIDWKLDLYNITRPRPTTFVTSPKELSPEAENWGEAIEILVNRWTGAMTRNVILLSFDNFHIARQSSQIQDVSHLPIEAAISNLLDGFWWNDDITWSAYLWEWLIEDPASGKAVYERVLSTLSLRDAIQEMVSGVIAIEAIDDIFPSIEISTDRNPSVYKVVVDSWDDLLAIQAAPTERGQWLRDQLLRSAKITLTGIERQSQLVGKAQWFRANESFTEYPVIMPAAWLLDELGISEITLDGDEIVREAEAIASQE